MTEQLYDYEPAQALDSPDAIALFIVDAMETGDASYVAKAIGAVVRAKGMTALANETGLTSEQLYDSFSDRGNPTLKTMLTVMRAQGVDLTARPHVQ